MFEKNNIETVIQKKLFQRIRAMNREGVEFDPLAPASDGVQDQAVQAWLAKSCWARVVSATVVQDNPTIGAQGPPGPPRGELMRMSSAFNYDGEGGYSPVNKPLASQESLFTSRADALFRPHAGITSINTSFISETMQTVDISWKLWDIREDMFTAYENAFLSHGRIVTVEFGWSTPQVVTDKVDISTVDGMRAIYKKQQEHILNMGGDYYVTTGKIINFDYTVGQNGELNCNTKLSAMANDMFAGQISDNENDAPIKIRTDSEDMERAIKISQNTFTNYIKSIELHLAERKDEEGVYCDEDTGRTWCTWGYFEDKILNTYFAFSSDWSKDIPVAGDHDNSSLLMYIRSKHFPNNSDDIIELENTCRYHSDIATKSLDIYLPGSVIDLPDSSADVLKNLDDRQKANYANLRRIMKGLKNKFANNKFHDETLNAGIIRNFVFSDEFYKNIWGSGTTTVKSGLNSHWNTVTSQYGGFWNFQARSDVYDTSRVGVFDREKQGPTDINVINPFKDPTQKTDFNNIVKDKCFIFSVYGRNSLITNFNVNVVVSSEMASMVTFSNNKPNTGQSYAGPEQLAIEAMAAFKFQKPANVEDSYPGAQDTADMVLKDLTFPFLDNKQVDRDGPNDPYVIKDFSGDGQSFVADPTTTLENKDTIIKEIDLISEKEDLDKDAKDKNYWYKKDGEVLEDKLIYDQNGKMLDIYSRTMLGLVNKNLVDPKTNVATANPFTPFNVSFTIPGIAGLKPFDMFHIDYLPEIQRQNCMFQISKVSHKLGLSGWTTDIESQMRIDGKEVNNKIKDAYTKTEIIDNEKQTDWLEQVNKLENEEKPKEPEDKQDWWNPWDWFDGK